MDRTLKTLKPAMLKLMRERYSEEEVSVRWEHIEKQYRIWLRDEGDLGGRKNMMSGNMVLAYLVFAFYDAMDRQLSREEFQRMFYDAMDGTLKLLDRFDMNRLEKKQWLMKLLYRIAWHYEKKSCAKRGNEWGNTWKIRVNPEHKTTGVAFVLDTCPMYEFAKKYGYLDVLGYMCETDHLIAKAFHAHLIRHRRLSDGDDTCEYWYVGDKSDEALKDFGSK